MKLRRFIKGIVFTSLSVILISTNVQASAINSKVPDLDDKNRLRLDEFSIEDQDEILNALSQAGYSNVLEEEEIDIADGENELDVINVSKLDLMNKMTEIGSSSDTKMARTKLTFEGRGSVADAIAREEANGGPNSSEFSIIDNSSDSVDVSSIKPSVVTGIPEVSDEEVKADFRYGLTKQQQLDSDGVLATHKRNNALRMRIQLEKMFDTKVDITGGEGKLHIEYFAGRTLAGKTDIHTYFARAYVNSQHSKDLENNKSYLTQLAKQTFADIDGTESYAYLIPTSVYYGLIDVEEVTADKALKSNGKYKEGDLLCHAHDNLTYAKLSKMITGYDGSKKEADWGKLKGTEYAYMANISTSSADDATLTPALANKQVLKGELIESIMNQSYLVHFRVITEGDNWKAMAKTFKDTPRFVDYGSEDDLNSAKMRQVFLNLAANPSKGVPLLTGYALVGADKAGLSVKDSKGNSNWTKKVTVGEAIEYWTQAARVDE